MTSNVIVKIVLRYLPDRILDEFPFVDARYGFGLQQAVEQLRLLFDLSGSPDNL